MALLDKEEDPYTRQPLKLHQLIELPQLKKEIQEWLSEQMKKIKVQNFKENALKKKKIQMEMEQKNLEDDSSEIF